MMRTKTAVLFIVKTDYKLNVIINWRIDRALQLYIFSILSDLHFNEKFKNTEN